MRRKPTQPKATGSFRTPSFERLEDRLAPAGDLVINVNDATDSFEGTEIAGLFFPSVTNNSSSISLREAIYLANQASSDTNVVINLQNNATYTLTRSSSTSFFSGDFYDDLDIHRGLTLNGHGSTIRGASFGAIEAALATSGDYQNVAINNLTIKDSIGYGLHASGKVNLDLTNVSFVNNRNVAANGDPDEVGSDALGAALIADTSGTVSIHGGTFEDNFARGGDGGGADSGNDGKNAGSAFGAAIYAFFSSVTIDGTTFKNNQATGGVGGFADDDNASGGLGGDSFGGAIYGLRSAIVITNATFDGNQAGSGLATGGEARHAGDRAGQGGSAYGGAIYLGPTSQLNATNTLFNENFANASTGGFGNSNNFYGQGGIAKGGAIYADATATRLDLNDGTQFTGNIAVGGAGGTAYFTGGGGSAGEGGAVWTGVVGAWTGLLFQDNGAIGGAGGDSGDGDGGQGGGGGAANGGAVQITNASVSIRNSLFDSNSAVAGEGGKASPTVARIGGRGGEARGGAVRVYGSSSVVTLLAGTQFTLNAALGGNGGNAGDFNLGQHGDGGDARGGAIASDFGSKLIASGTLDSTVDFAGNGAAAGNAGMPVAGRDILAISGRGGDAYGGAIFADGGLSDATKGFSGEFVHLLGNKATAGMGSTGLVTRRFLGKNRINVDKVAFEFANVDLYKFGRAAGDAGAAYGGGIYNVGDLTLRDVAISGNKAVGFRGEDDGGVLNVDSGVSDSGVGYAGAHGGNAYGGGVYTKLGDVIAERVLAVGNAAMGGTGGRGGSGVMIQGDVHRVPQGNDPGLISTWVGEVHGGRGGDGGIGAGGAFYVSLESDQTMSVHDTMLSGNKAIGGRGGDGGHGLADESYGIDGKVLGGDGGNGGAGVGGGIALTGGSIEIVHSQIQSGVVIGGDAGAGGNPPLSQLWISTDSEDPTIYKGGNGGAGGDAAGGGVWLSNAKASIAETTLYDNIVSSGWGGAGGNAFNDERLTYSFGSHGGDGGDAGSARGGAIAVVASELTLDNSTVASNRVLSGGGGMGGKGATANWRGGSGGNGGDGGEAEGGGIWAGGGGGALPISKVNVKRSTISDNGIEAGVGGLPGLAGIGWMVDSVFPNVAREWKPLTFESFEIVDERTRAHELRFVPDASHRLTNTFAIGSAAVLASGNVQVAAGTLTSPSQAQAGLIFPSNRGPAIQDDSELGDAISDVRKAYTIATVVTTVVAETANELARLALLAEDGGVIALGASNGKSGQLKIAVFLAEKAAEASTRIGRRLAGAAVRLATRGVLTAVRLVSKVAGPASLAIDVAIEVGQIVVFSLVYGKGDFLKGLKIYANENAVDPSLLKDTGAAGQLAGVFFGVKEDLTEYYNPPAKRDGVRGRMGAVHAPSGSGLFFEDSVMATLSRNLIVRNQSAAREMKFYAWDQENIVIKTYYFPYDSRFSDSAYFWQARLDVPNYEAFGPARSEGYNNIASSNERIVSAEGDEIDTSRAQNTFGVGTVLTIDYSGVSVIHLVDGAGSSNVRNAGPILETAETSQNGYVRQAGERASIGAWDGPPASQTTAPTAANIDRRLDIGTVVDYSEISLVDLATDTSGLGVTLGQVTKIELDSGNGSPTVILNPSIITAPTANTLSIYEQNRRLQYAPPAHFVGVVRIYYTVTNGDKESEPAAITLTYEATLSNATIAENAGADAEVGMMATEDAGPFTYSLPAGVDDNASFRFDGAHLLARSSLDYETKASYWIPFAPPTTRAPPSIGVSRSPSSTSTTRRRGATRQSPRFRRSTTSSPRAISDSPTAMYPRTQ